MEQIIEPVVQATDPAAQATDPAAQATESIAQPISEEPAVQLNNPNDLALAIGYTGADEHSPIGKITGHVLGIAVAFHEGRADAGTVPAILAELAGFHHNLASLLK